MTAASQPALLALADGATFRGRSVGALGEAAGEVVFNTSMTGYQEILTDPSYAGQLVCLTYPLIGNYGVNDDDVESRQPWAGGLIVRELAHRSSSWRSKGSLGGYLAAAGIVAIDDIDTRALTRHIRIHGSQMAVLTTTTTDEAVAVARARAAVPIGELDLVRQVECAGQYELAAATTDGSPESPGSPVPHVVAIDSGVKRNILRQLAARGCRLTVVPASASAAQIRALRPDGLFLANGPGDPRQAPYLVETVRDLIEEDLPVFGICLGHQILALAMDATIFKLKFGHHGGNHPVLDIERKLIAITSQNHNYAVEAESLPAHLSITHTNLNDSTVEGLAHRHRPIFSIQYHPEAAPGPHDSLYLFDRFVSLLAGDAIAGRPEGGGVQTPASAVPGSVG